MGDLADGESVDVQGSAAAPYVLRNTGGVYSCTCLAWRNQSIGIEVRTCKHLRKLRGDAAETVRVGASSTAKPARKAASKAAGDGGDAADGDGDDADAGPPILLAERWDGARDLTGWWMSEKLDGVRALWDGRAFISRLGNTYRAPAWFTAGLPAQSLDGELWVGRKQFQRTVSIVRRTDASDLWREVRYVVFDAPSHDAPFEERVARCRELLGAHTPHASVHEQRPCEGVDALRAELARVEAEGGEGLMLREPGSRYVAGRSATLLKIKTFHDAEARIVDHSKGAGRHKGRLGALVVELPDGTRFSVGTGFSDAERESPPPLGSVITFRYQELSSGGVPRFPTYVGVRHDVRLPAASPVPSPAPEPVAIIDDGGAMRRFESQEAKRFWEIDLRWSEFTINAGALGAEGQSRKKTFPSAVAAAQVAEELVAEKLSEGYIERAAAPAAAAAPPPPPAPAPAPARPAAPAKAAPAPKPKPAAAPAPASAVGGPKRRFECNDSGSSKFWEIAISGSSFSVTFGKIGTSGQTKSKTFADAAAASKEAQKLVEEKSGKGYLEVTRSPAGEGGASAREEEE